MNKNQIFLIVVVLFNGIIFLLVYCTSINMQHAVFYLKKNKTPCCKETNQVGGCCFFCMCSLKVARAQSADFSGI